MSAKETMHGLDHDPARSGGLNFGKRKSVPMRSGIEPSTIGGKTLNINKIRPYTAPLPKKKPASEPPILYRRILSFLGYEGKWKG